MKHRLPLTVLLLLLITPAFAGPGPTILGLWRTQDKGGVIAITECGGRVCAHIAGVVLDNPADPMPVDSRGVSQCGLQLINDAVETKPNLWNGHILDPRNGSVFRVELWLQPDGRLALRGYIGVTLLGRTESWTRYTGTVPRDCRLTPSRGAE